MDQATSYPVVLYIYDLSKGFASQMSAVMLGKQIDGIWHTGVVVYGKEFFFGSKGIMSCPPSGTFLGNPDRTEDLGSTEITKEKFTEYLASLSESTFRRDKYNLLENNCNTFTSEVAHFLTGKKIPSYITDLPGEVLSTPFGAIFRPLLAFVSVNPGGDNATGQQ